MKASFPLANFWLNISWQDDLILESFFSKEPMFLTADLSKLDSFGKKIMKDLDNYVSTGFIDVLKYKVQLENTSPFFKAVYEKLREVPAGKVVTYKGLAQACGRPKSARAVGLAMRKNKIQLFIPCHRVVGVNNPGGWSGLKGVKEFLLQLEKAGAKT